MDDQFLKHIRLKRLSSFSADTTDLSPDEFLTRFSSPFLLVQLMTTVFDVKAWFDRSTAHATANPEDGGSSSPKKEQFVVSVERSGQNPSKDIIIGRSANSDILLPHLAVSREHACVLLDEGKGQYSLMDLGSGNGTTFNSVPLEPHVPQPLQSGDVIVFGRLVLCTFYHQAQMHQFLRQN